MRWKGRRTSSNIEDRRGRNGISVGRGAGGLGVLLIVLAGAFFGVDMTGLLGTGGTASLQGGPVAAPVGPNRIDDDTEEFVAVVPADTETVWSEIFAASDLRYSPPTLVLYSGRTASACGGADTAMGPFYCPGDQKIFLDTDFFRVMEAELGARGDFAKAYVIAHEVAHHVQNLLGVMEQVHAERLRSSSSEANALSVRVELQADCYAGVWARALGDSGGVLERGDIREALETAARIGDDALQMASQGVVIPDSFTHGTSEQRQRWFHAGFESGDPAACDTFRAARL